MFQFAQRRKLYFLISAAVIIPGLIAMTYSTISFGSPVRLSIDFTGGTIMDVSFVEDLGEQDVRNALEAYGVDDYIVQQLDPIQEPAANQAEQAQSRFLITIDQIATAETAAEGEATTPDNAAAQQNFNLEEALRAFLVSPEGGNLGTVWTTTVEEKGQDVEKEFIRASVSETGGLTLDISFANEVSESQVQDALTKFSEEYADEFGAQFALADATVQRLNPMPAEAGSRWQIRVDETDSDRLEALRNYLATNLSEFWTPDITNPAREVTSSSISATVGEEVTRAALVATLAVAVIILFFIVWAFRQVPHAIRYGACAIAAMFHDILVTMGVMSILGVLFGWEADALFLTAVLTVVGYSVQDTIVVFDRIRENIPKYRGEDYDMIVNRSVLETIHRSLATQLNAVFVMIAILLFGGETIRQFIAILLIGLMSGTYSSIFNAVPLLVSWEKGEIPFVNREARKRKQEEAAVTS